MNYKEIEQKWQNIWKKEDVFKAIDFSPKPKWYNLLEFPYPSAYGMHNGHMKAYTGLEVDSRMRRLMGYNVMFPMGWDAFGLPAENFAIKTNTPPRISTDKCIAGMIKQFDSMGFSFDWSREVDTTNPEYFKWTQWIFLQMFKKGIAYKSKAYVNFCPKCSCILSNEDSQGGVCDRCNSEVIQKEKEVWFLKIRDYAERLLNNLEKLDFPDKVKEEQRNWIGKSTGAEIRFGTMTDTKKSDSLVIYTTRADTLFGVTFAVLAPEHPLVEKYKDCIKNYEQVKNYIAETRKKSEFARVQINKDKSGVLLEGIYAIHPITKNKIPLFIADYVMMGYGTGAIMAVPAHDTRDHEFAIKYNLPIIQVISGDCDIQKEPYTLIDSGTMINSDFLNGKNVKDAIAKMIEYLVSNKLGNAKVDYQMKDWAFNRQRYWGEPFPIVYCEKCGTVGLNENQLPLKLPEVKDFKPSANGQSPLASIDEWVNCKCPTCGGPAKRETDTMPNWAGSSWYFLRYMDPKNSSELVDRKILNYWGQIDCYNGGTEHVTRHLIYSRFWNMFLYDQGITPFEEPYKKRTCIGLVLGEDGTKMSKSLGNVVDPMEVANEYSADVLRLYILFMGDYASAAPWSSKNISGCKRFLDRVCRMTDFIDKQNGIHEAHIQDLNSIIEGVTADTESQKYNTAISKLMTFVNKIYNDKYISKDEFKVFLTLLYPYGPHIAEELNEQIGGTMLCKSSWPKIINTDAKKYFNVPVQINGKVKTVLNVIQDISQDAILKLAQVDAKVAQALNGAKIQKIIYVSNKILNILI